MKSLVLLGASVAMIALTARAEEKPVQPNPTPVRPPVVQPPQEASKLPYPENHAKVLAEAEQLGAPLVAIRRAMKEAESKAYSKHDVLAVYDISQPGAKKRFYLIDLKAGTTTAYHVAHGKGNGAHAKATAFRGFNNPGSNMTPLGALRTGNSGYSLDHYTEVTDTVTGKTWNGLLIMDLEGVKGYNSNINRGNIWVVMHTKWYATEGFRSQNQGALGRSLGCIVFDPVFNNKIINRMAGGSLLYVTVGNDAIEKYL